MMRVSLDIMLSKPGIYVLTGSRGMTFVEVEAEGRCHQLELTNFTRDGELTGGRWLIGDMIIFGPFFRAPQQ